MRRKLIVLAVAAALFMLSIIASVYAAGRQEDHEIVVSPTVGGEVSPASSVMTLTLAAVLGIASVAFMVVTALIRIKKT